LVLNHTVGEALLDFLINVTLKNLLLHWRDFQVKSVYSSMCDFFAIEQDGVFLSGVMLEDSPFSEIVERNAMEEEEIMADANNEIRSQGLVNEWRKECLDVFVAEMYEEKSTQLARLKKAIKQLKFDDMPENNEALFKEIGAKLLVQLKLGKRFTSMVLITRAKSWLKDWFDDTGALDIPAQDLIKQGLAHLKDRALQVLHPLRAKQFKTLSNSTEIDRTKRYYWIPKIGVELPVTNLLQADEKVNFKVTFNRDEKKSDVLFIDASARAPRMI
jgi:hypothetical protein